MSNNPNPLPYNLGGQWDWSYPRNTTLLMKQIPNYEELPIVSTSNITGVESFSHYLLSSRKDYHASRYGAISWQECDVEENSFVPIAHGNYTAGFAFPTFSNIAADAVLRQISNNSATVSAHMYPFARTQRQKDEDEDFNSFTFVTFMFLGMPFIPAGFALSLVRERETKAKHQQMVPTHAQACCCCLLLLFVVFIDVLTIVCKIVLVCVGLSV